MSPWFLIVMICKHFLLLLLSAWVWACVFIFLNAVFCFLSLGNKWERAVVSVTHSDGQHSTRPDPHQTRSHPAETLLLSFSTYFSCLFHLLLFLFLSFWLLPHLFFRPSPLPLLLSTTESVTCFLFTLISLHLQLFSLLPLSSVSTLICNLILVASITGNVEDFSCMQSQM